MYAAIRVDSRAATNRIAHQVYLREVCMVGRCSHSRWKIHMEESALHRSDERYDVTQLRRT